MRVILKKLFKLKIVYFIIYSPILYFKMQKLGEKSFSVKVSRARQKSVKLKQSIFIIFQFMFVPIYTSIYLSIYLPIYFTEYLSIFISIYQLVFH